MARLREVYTKEIHPKLMADLGLSNVMAVPRLEKIVINMGVGEGTQDKKRVETAAGD